MPHDKNNKLLQVGDIVTLTGTVNSLQVNEDFCNCNVKSDHIPPNQMGFSATLCTKETELADSSLRFSALRDGNTRRLPEFKNPKGEKFHTKDDGSDWSPLEWGGAAGREMGELLNFLKKLRRGDMALDEFVPGEGITLRECIAKECADVVCYVDHVAHQVGVDLGEAVREKFNEVSERVGSKVKIR